MPESKPPEGYQTWLDFAVATMDTRSVFNDLCFAGRPVVQRDVMDDAARTELAELRADAEKWRKHEAECPRGCRPIHGCHDVEDLYEQEPRKDDDNGN